MQQINVVHTNYHHNKIASFQTRLFMGQIHKKSFLRVVVVYF